MEGSYAHHYTTNAKEGQTGKQMGQRGNTGAGRGLGTGKGWNEGERETRVEQVTRTKEGYKREKLRQKQGGEKQKEIGSVRGTYKI